MWLIDTTTLRLEQIVDLQDCKYAILSHTWEKDEVDFQEMLADSRPARLLKKAGFLKIKKTCEVAKEKGYEFAWVDTCCIDKTSSAALSEAINSMFHWYKESSLCLAYLSDLEVNNFEHAESKTSEFMKDCVWFTRGWTLQELIGPEELEFYDQEWKFRGSKKTLRHELSKITGIEIGVLEDSELLPTIPVARRMSWAAHRKTTRVEDIAYCLFGIFGVNMPMIYGEGKNAFLRLQEEIAKSTNDLTLFAWTSQNESGVDRRPTHSSQQGKDLRGILAQSPSEFVDCGRLRILRDGVAPVKEFAMTNNGLRVETFLGSSPEKEYVFALDCVNDNNRRLGIYLMKTEFGFVRDRAYELFSTTDKSFWNGKRTTRYIARTLSNSLALRLRAQLLQSLNFRFHLHPRASYSVERIRPRPSSLWDSNGKLFLTGNRHDFTACVEFSLKPLWWRFVIVCGLIDVRSENPRVSDPWDEENHFSAATPWMAIFTDQDPSARPQLEIIDRLKKGNDELRKLRSTVLSWYVDENHRLPLRRMAETIKTVFIDDDGREISYHLGMIKEANFHSKGTPVFNIRVFISEVTRVRDSSTMGEVGSEEDEASYARAGPGPQAPQPPSADRDPPSRPSTRRPNPFSPQPGPGQRHYTDPGPYPFQPYVNPYPHVMPEHSYGSGPSPGQWAGPPGYYPPGPEYPHGGGRPAGYR